MQVHPSFHLHVITTAWFGRSKLLIPAPTPTDLHNRPAHSTRTKPCVAVADGTSLQSLAPFKQIRTIILVLLCQLLSMFSIHRQGSGCMSQWVYTDQNPPQHLFLYYSQWSTLRKCQSQSNLYWSEPAPTPFSSITHNDQLCENVKVSQICTDQQAAELQNNHHQF